jgi:peptide-methionine (S)-S-oxide reductase
VLELFAMFLVRKKTEMPNDREALPGRASPMPVTNRHAVSGRPILAPFPEQMQQMQQMLFGMGCFWGAERSFWTLEGVFTTAVGYAGGSTPNPTYEEVCSGYTGHNEVVLVVFDPAASPFTRLLTNFLGGA